MNEQLLEKLKNIRNGSYIIVKNQTDSCEIIAAIQKSFKVNFNDLSVIVKQGNNIKIAQIRNIKHNIHLTPQGKYKIIIIDNAEDLNQESGNSLLKILEEPPKHAIIILLVKNIYHLLPTIISRCQKITLLPNVKDNQKQYFKLFNQLNDAKNIAEKFSLANSIIEQKIDVKQMIIVWINYLKISLNKQNIKTIKILAKFEKIYNPNLNQKLFLENIFLII